MATDPVLVPDIMDDKQIRPEREVKVREGRAYREGLTLDQRAELDKRIVEMATLAYKWMRGRCTWENGGMLLDDLAMEIDLFEGRERLFEDDDVTRDISDAEDDARAVCFE